jgi:uncharacterized protein (TIGR03118 family)
MGMALAPASFGEFANDILVGNFGDGAINAYDPANGHWLGMLADGAGKPIVNAGLWSVTFSGGAGANAAGSVPDTLYITAGLLGPTHEKRRSVRQDRAQLKSLLRRVRAHGRVWENYFLDWDVTSPVFAR